STSPKICFTVCQSCVFIGTVASGTLALQFLSGQLVLKPCLCRRPIAFDACRRNLQKLSCFFDSQAGEVTQLNHPDLLLIELGETVEGFIERDHIDVDGCRCQLQMVKFNG